LLIAAFASLSTVLFLLDDERELELEDDDLDEVFLAGRAIFDLLRRGKDNLLPLRFPNVCLAQIKSADHDKCKGHRCRSCSDALRHGQRPKVTAVRSALAVTNTPLRPPCWTMRHRITSFRCV